MTVTEALTAVKEAGMMAWREAWEDDPLLKGSVIVYHPRHEFIYWHKDAPVPDRYADDDPRLGASLGTLPISSIMAHDWKVVSI